MLAYDRVLPDQNTVGRESEPSSFIEKEAWFFMAYIVCPIDRFKASGIDSAQIMKF